MSSIWDIRRSTSDVKVAGVCGGVARHWGVDPVLIRVGFLLLALSGGIGVVLYLAGWLLVPADGRTTAPAGEVLGEQVRRWPREAWVAIVVVCCLVVFAALGSITPLSFGPAAILALIWYFGYYKNRRPRGVPAAADRVGPGTPPPAAPQFYSHAGPPTPFTEAADAWRLRVEETQRQAGPGVAAPVPVPTSPAPGPTAYQAYLATPDPVGLYAPVGEPAAVAVPPRRSASLPARRLRLVSLAVLGLALSGLGLASAQGVAVTPAVYAATALLVLGLTLVAATWFGRARGVLPVALLVALVTVATTVGGPVPHRQGWDTRVAHTDAAQLAAGDQQDLGRLRIDLTGLTLTRDASYRADVGTGQLQVLAPAGVNVVVVWRVRSGAFLVDGTESGDRADHGTLALTRTDPRLETLTLNLSVDRGVVQVDR